MQVQVRQPVVVGVPLDDTTADVLGAAVDLAGRLDTTLVPVHAVAAHAFSSAARRSADIERARAAVLSALEPFVAQSAITITEPFIAAASSATCVLETATRVDAQLVVVGGGHGPTVGGWLLGTVADRVVRSARCPVFVARGALPGPTRAILCPVDLTPHAHLGFEAALRFARRFEAPLDVLTVLPAIAHAGSLDALDEEAARLERATREELAMLVRAHDVRGVQLAVRVVSGEPADAILDASQRAQLVVLASRSFDMLAPASVGDVASRVLRNARCSILAVRDRDGNAEARVQRIAYVVELRNRARDALEAGELDRAQRLLEIAHAELPGQAAIEDDLATVLDRAGRSEAASRHRAVARILRDFHT